MAMVYFDQERQFSDYISSYYDALKKTDGEVFLVGTNATIREAGLRIHGASLRLGWSHCLSFDIQAVDGLLDSIGCRLEAAYDVRIVIDGTVVLETDASVHSVELPGDYDTHHIEVYFTVENELEPMRSAHMYLLPNSKVVGDKGYCFPPYSANISNLKLDVLERG